MIERLTGKIVKKNSGEVIIDCNGVGYSAAISLNTCEALPDEGANAVLLTVLVHREDAMQLYGFFTDAERDAFKMLTQISGVGSKTALSILSSLELSELRNHVLTNNVQAIRKIPGIGPKSADRLILELRDKIQKLEIADEDDIHAGSPVKSEVISALVTLGYNKAIAEKAVKKALDEEGASELGAEALIRKALRHALS